MGNADSDQQDSHLNWSRRREQSTNITFLMFRSTLRRHGERPAVPCHFGQSQQDFTQSCLHGSSTQFPKMSKVKQAKGSPLLQSPRHRCKWSLLSQPDLTALSSPGFPALNLPSTTGNAAFLSLFWSSLCIPSSEPLLSPPTRSPHSAQQPSTPI